METASELRLQGVVTGLSEILELPVRVESEELREWDQTLCCDECRRSREWIRRVEKWICNWSKESCALREIAWQKAIRPIVVGPQVRGMLSNICNVCNQIGCQFALDLEAPVLNHWRPAIRFRNVGSCAAASIEVHLRRVQVWKSDIGWGQAGVEIERWIESIRRSKPRLRLKTSASERAKIGVLETSINNAVSTADCSLAGT